MSHQAGNFKRRKTQAEIIKEKTLANRSINIFLRNRFEELLAAVERERESTSRFCKIVFAVLYRDSEFENKEGDEGRGRVRVRGRSK